MASVYQKTADDKCIILQPREAFQREMNIPADWKVLDLCIGFSATTSSDPNENLYVTFEAYNSVLDRTRIGVKSGEQIAPGLAGTKFIGLTYPTNMNEGIGNRFGQQLQHCGDLSPYPQLTNPGAVFSDGVSDTWVGWLGGPGVSPPVPGSAAPNVLLTGQRIPSDATEYFAWRLMRIRRDNPATLSVTAFNIPDQTDASDEALINTLTNTNMDAVRTSIATTVPQSWDVRHMYLRLPFTNARARIHNYGYRLVS